MSIFLGDQLVTNAYLGSETVVNATLYSELGIISSSVLYLDFTNEASYPGSGGIWYDLSGYDNHAYMDNLTQLFYTASSYGGFFGIPVQPEPNVDYDRVPAVSHSVSLNVFDGDYSILMVGSIDASLGPSSGSGTNADYVSFYSKPAGDANQSIGILINRNDDDPNFNTFAPTINGLVPGFGSVGGEVFGNNFIPGLGQFFVNHVVREGGYMSMYDTDNNDNYGPVAGDVAASNGNNTGDLFIGRWKASIQFNYWFQGGKIVAFAIYDRGLTEAERQQNIDYFKTRIGF
jgi:hypothetical protein